MITELNYIGSFQNGETYFSEDPLEEAWARIAKHGVGDFLKKICVLDSDSLTPDKFFEYVITRNRQSVEFRQSARNASLLTSSLNLYYSFLNLLRSFYALSNGDFPNKGVSVNPPPSFLPPNFPLC